MDAVHTKGSRVNSPEQISYNRLYSPEPIEEEEDDTNKFYTTSKVTSHELRTRLTIPLTERLISKGKTASRSLSKARNYLLATTI